VGALAGLGALAHGGIAGAIAESALVLVVASVFVAVWIRERRGDRERAPEGPARLREDEEPPPS
jgi:hypothetical protein